MELVWLPESRDDIKRLYDFLLDKNPLAAERAARAIQLGAEKLREVPHIGRYMDDDTQRREFFLRFGAGAYVLRYRIDAARVVVIRVWHSREER